MKEVFYPSLEFTAKGAFVSIGISAIAIALIVPAITISGYSISPDHVFFIIIEEFVKIASFRILKRDAVGICLGFGLLEFFFLKIPLILIDYSDNIIPNIFLAIPAVFMHYVTGVILGTTAKKFNYLYAAVPMISVHFAFNALY